MNIVVNDNDKIPWLHSVNFIIYICMRVALKNKDNAFG